MPKQFNQKTAASKPRLSAGRRANQKRPGCKKSTGSKAGASSIRPNTLFTVKLLPKRGYEAIDEINETHEPVKSIATDLLRSVNFGLKALYGEAPIKTAADITQKELFDLVIDTLKNRLLPAGYSFNIEKENGDYYLVMFKPIGIGWHWHYFPVKPIICFLEKTDPELLKLYLSAINILRTKCRISSWWGGNFYPYQMLVEDTYGYDDFIANSQTGDEEEDAKLKADFDACINNYNEGMANKYQSLICKAPNSITALKAKILKYNRQHPVVKLINKIIALAAPGFNIREFEYDAVNGDDYWDGEPLDLPQQLTIIWTEDDELFKEACEHIDMHAGEFGVLEPVITIELNIKVKKKDFSGTDLKEAFWKNITELWQYNYDLTRKYKKHE